MNKLPNFVRPPRDPDTGRQIAELRNRVRIHVRNPGRANTKRKAVTRDIQASA